MKKLISNTTTFGPFESIVETKQGYDCDGTMYPFTVVGTCQIEDWTGPIPAPVYDYTESNLQTAKQILAETDWTSIPAVADPLRSNPYLGNQSAFDDYRNLIRAIAINPPSTAVNWPGEPDEVWVEA